MYGEVTELAEGVRLLSVCRSKAYRGFESLPLRHILVLVGQSPSGKAPGFGPGIRGFKSSLPSQLNFNGMSSNGRTADSGSVRGGSSPPIPAIYRSRWISAPIGFFVSQSKVKREWASALVCLYAQADKLRRCGIWAFPL